MQELLKETSINEKKNIRICNSYFLIIMKIKLTISCWWIIEHFMLNAEWLSSSLLCLAKLHQAKSRNCDNTLTLR